MFLMVAGMLVLRKSRLNELLDRQSSDFYLPLVKV